MLTGQLNLDNSHSAIWIVRSTDVWANTEWVSTHLKALIHVYRKSQIRSQGVGKNVGVCPSHPKQNLNRDLKNSSKK